MNKRNAKQKPVALLLLLAMLILCVAAILPVVATADAAEITDFSYQTPVGATTSDDSVDLRFLFKIDTLDGYEKVGFVFSKSNDAPTIGGEHCGVYETTSAYSAINAGGEPLAAGEGRWWVAVKLAGIPKASFDKTVYVVGYVKAEGEDPVYSDVYTLTACAALGHDYEWTSVDGDEHEKTCAVCGDVVAVGHNFSMTVSEGVATYTCADCGYSYQTDVKTMWFEATPSLNKFNNTQDETHIVKSSYDSDGDTVNDCVRTEITNASNKKYWINYNNANPTYSDEKTNVISFKTDFRIVSGAVPSNGDLFFFYYSFSGNASGGNDQGYGFRFHQTNAGKIEMKAFGAENGMPIYDKTLEYDAWYSIRCDVTVTTAGSTHTLQSIRMYVDDQLVHTVNLADLSYASYSTNKARMMIIGIGDAAVTFDIKNIGTFVGAVK